MIVSSCLLCRNDFVSNRSHVCCKRCALMILNDSGVIYLTYTMFAIIVLELFIGILIATL